MKFISYSQISYVLIQVNTLDSAEFLGRLAARYWRLKDDVIELIAKKGLIKIHDGTYVKLPDSIFPEKMIPSTWNHFSPITRDDIIEKEKNKKMNRQKKEMF